MDADRPARTGSLWREALATAHDIPSEKQVHSGKAKRGALGDLVNHMVHMGPSLDCADGVDKADLHMGSTILSACSFPARGRQHHQGFNCTCGLNVRPYRESKVLHPVRQSECGVPAATGLGWQFMMVVNTPHMLSSAYAGLSRHRFTGDDRAPAETGPHWRRCRSPSGR